MGVVSWLPALLLLCGSRACAGLPTFQNGNFMMSTGVPFTLQWSGNQGAVTIDLYTAPESSRKLMMNVVTNMTDTSYSWTPPDSIQSGTYSFQIQDAAGEINYSRQFTYTQTLGAVAPATTSPNAPPPSTTTTASTTAAAPPYVTATVNPWFGGAASSGDPEGGDLSATQKAGVGVGAGIGGAALLALLCWIFYRYGKRRGGGGGGGDATTDGRRRTGPAGGPAVHSYPTPLSPRDPGVGEGYGAAAWALDDDGAAAAAHDAGRPGSRSTPRRHDAEKSATDQYHQMHRAYSGLTATAGGGGGNAAASFVAPHHHHHLGSESSLGEYYHHAGGGQSVDGNGGGGGFTTAAAAAAGGNSPPIPQRSPTFSSTATTASSTYPPAELAGSAATAGQQQQHQQHGQHHELQTPANTAELDAAISPLSPPPRSPRRSAVMAALGLAGQGKGGGATAPEEQGRQHGRQAGRDQKAEEEKAEERTG